MRCSRPGVPGIAHGRASVAGSRRYGRNVVPSSAVGLGGELDPQVGQVGDLGQQPRLGAVGDVAVGEQHHRRAVGQRDPGRLDRGVEAVGRRPGRDHRGRGLAVPAEQGHVEVGLLGLGRHAGATGRPAARRR